MKGPQQGIISFMIKYKPRAYKRIETANTIHIYDTVYACRTLDKVSFLKESLAKSSILRSSWSILFKLSILEYTENN